MRERGSRRRPAIGAAAALLLAGCGAAARPPATPAPAGDPGSAAFEAAVDAYVYGFAPVLLDVVRERATSAPGASTNQLRNVYELLTAESRAVVAPNQDTQYSTSWLDLRAEPLVLDLPPTSGRYHLFPLLDAYTEVFASPGTRTTGDEGGAFAICGPLWRGELPPGVTRIDSPTPDAWLLGRTLLRGPDDLPEVAALLRRYSLTPLSRWARGERAEPFARRTSAPASGAGSARAPPVPPLEAMLAWDAPTFYGRLAAVLGRNPPPARDAPVLARLAAIGLDGADGRYSPEGASLTPADWTRAATEGLARIRAHVPAALPRVNGWAWAATLGAYGTSYLNRAAVALVGLGANLPEDTVYARAEHDAAGRPLVGAHRYVVRFAPDALPPVDAFWSLTLYGPDNYFAANPLGRYLLRDRDPLVREADGSLVLRIQHEAPAGAAETANWLPAPAGEFVLMLRMYRPRAELLAGAWQPPAIERIE